MSPEVRVLDGVLQRNPRLAAVIQDVIEHVLAIGHTVVAAQRQLHQHADFHAAQHAVERDALLAGRLYIQLHAERGVAPDNAVLWGWLLTSQVSSTCQVDSR